MKNLSIILNIVLFVALGVLYFLHFNLKSKINSGYPVMSKTGTIANGNIVYVNIDTLINSYDAYFDMKKSLEEKQKKSEAELNTRSNTYQKGVADYQDKVQKGLITRSRAQEIEQQLMADQQNLLKFRDNLAADLADEQQVMNRQLINDIVEYLKEYNKYGKYQYILSHSFGSALLYVPDSLDITKDVLKGLNHRYDTKREKSK
jgi:outer membrane protein